MPASAPDPLAFTSSVLSRVALFSTLDAAAIDAVRASARPVTFQAGETIFRQGDPATLMYVVIRGSVQVIVEEGANARIVDTLGPGAVLGEMALLLDEPRSATVIARRDSELLALDEPAFESLLDRHPGVTRHVAEVLGSRLKKTTHSSRPVVETRVIAVIARHPEITGLLDRLIRELHAQGRTAAVVTRGNRSERDDWEDRFDFVFYIADESADWSQWSLRQADMVLVVVDAAQPLDASAMPASRRARCPAMLVLVRDAGEPRNAAAWLDDGYFTRHVHLHHRTAADYGRLARYLTGQSVGLVLSGGGARGFAHVGVIESLHRHGIPIDAIGGASMGAIVAAQAAMGADTNAIAAGLRQAFVERQPFDFTVPIVALSSGRETVRKLRRLFGERHIEDLATPYFCVSTDLTTADSRVHDRGPVWLWTRVSCAIPGLAPPVVHDGHVLADGGLLNNLPADVMRTRSARVIAVDVTPDVDLAVHGHDGPPQISGWRHLWDRLRGRAEMHPTIVDILTRAALIGSKRDAGRTAAHSDLLIKPEIAQFGMGDFAAIDALIDAGRRAADAALPQWIRHEHDSSSR